MARCWLVFKLNDFFQTYFDTPDCHKCFSQQMEIWHPQKFHKQHKTCVEWQRDTRDFLSMIFGWLFSKWAFRSAPARQERVVATSERSCGVTLTKLPLLLEMATSAKQIPQTRMHELFQHEQLVQLREVAEGQQMYIWLPMSSFGQKYVPLRFVVRSSDHKQDLSHLWGWQFAKFGRLGFKNTQVADCVPCGTCDRGILLILTELSRLFCQLEEWASR